MGKTNGYWTVFEDLDALGAHNVLECFADELGEEASWAPADPDKLEFTSIDEGCLILAPEYWWVDFISRSAAADLLKGLLLSPEHRAELLDSHGPLAYFPVFVRGISKQIERALPAVGEVVDIPILRSLDGTRLFEVRNSATQAASRGSFQIDLLIDSHSKSQAFQRAANRLELNRYHFVPAGEVFECFWDLSSILLWGAAISDEPSVLPDWEDDGRVNWEPAEAREHVHNLAEELIDFIAETSIDHDFSRDSSKAAS